MRNVTSMWHGIAVALMLSHGALAGDKATPASDEKPKLNVIFTVSLENGAEKRLRQVLMEKANRKILTESSCEEDANLNSKIRGRDMDRVDRDFPDREHSRSVRLFFRCETVDSDKPYVVFAKASLAIARETIGHRQHPVRVVADTFLKTQGAGCSAEMCQNGSFRWTTDFVNCTPCP